MKWYHRIVGIGALVFGLGCSAIRYHPEDYAAGRNRLEQARRVELTPENFDEQIKQMSYFEVISSINTPRLTVLYTTKYLEYKLDLENYGVDQYIASLRETHERRRGDCEDGAVCGPSLLADDGYRFRILRLLRPDEPGHVVSIYDAGNNTYGCISIYARECLIEGACRDLPSLLRYLNSVTNKPYDRYSLIPTRGYEDGLRHGRGHLQFVSDLYERAKIHPMPEDVVVAQNP